MAEVHKRREEDAIPSCCGAVDRNPGFQRNYAGVISDQGKGAIPTHAGASADGGLLQGKEMVIGELDQAACQELGSENGQLSQPLGFSQPGEESSVG